MRIVNLILSTTIALAIAGCGAKEEPAAPGGTSTTNSTSTSDGTSSIAKLAAYELGSKKVGDKGICIVCSTNEGKLGAEEEVKQTLDYKGKTYIFCNENEKAEFISDPTKFVKD